MRIVSGHDSNRERLSEPGRTIIRKEAAWGLDSDKVRFESQAIIRGTAVPALTWEDQITLTDL